MKQEYAFPVFILLQIINPIVYIDSKNYTVMSYTAIYLNLMIN